jgi:hypothetical protein
MNRDELSEVKVLRRDLILQTEGLSQRDHPELWVRVDDPGLVAEAENFLRFVVDYIETQSTRIRPGETLAYGYWLTKFDLVDDGMLHVFEYNPEATEFIPGLKYTLTYWRDQHKTCAQFNASFSPPRPDKMVAISDGVMEGDPVEGVRYPSPEHMSGWWLTTDRYNGDISTIKTTHLHHVTAKRPDLVRFVALPYGYRFNGQDVWYDEKVVSVARMQ